MDFTDHPLQGKQYSNSSFSLEKHSNSTVEQVFSSLADVIPVDDYMPFYVSQYKKLGAERFIELANKARATSDTPARLFAWMLKNNKLVK